MSNPMLHATLLALLIVGLVGCSSTEDKVYQSFRCAKVASLLGEERDALKAMEKSAEDRDKLRRKIFGLFRVPNGYDIYGEI